MPLTFEIRAIPTAGSSPITIGVASSSPTSAGLLFPDESTLIPLSDTSDSELPPAVVAVTVVFAE